MVAHSEQSRRGLSFSRGIERDPGNLDSAAKHMEPVVCSPVVRRGDMARRPRRNGRNTRQWNRHRRRSQRRVETGGEREWTLHRLDESTLALVGVDEQLDSSATAAARNYASNGSHGMQLTNSANCLACRCGEPRRSARGSTARSFRRSGEGPGRSIRPTRVTLISLRLCDCSCTPRCGDATELALRLMGSFAVNRNLFLRDVCPADRCA